MARCFGRIILFTNVADGIVGFAASVEQQYLLVGEYFELLTLYCLDFDFCVQPLNLPSIATAPLSHSSASASKWLLTAAAAVL